MARRLLYTEAKVNRLPCVLRSAAAALQFMACWRGKIALRATKSVVGASLMLLYYIIFARLNFLSLFPPEEELPPSLFFLVDDDGDVICNIVSTILQPRAKASARGEFE